MKKQNSSLINSFKCEFPVRSINEGFARAVTTAFVSQLDPRIGELNDVKTAVSEAVTNCIVHAYAKPKPGGENKKPLIKLWGEYYSSGKVVIIIKDTGCGIEDIERARQPLFTTDGENERSGMGFTVMESFCDRISVKSKPGKGTSVRLEKNISPSINFRC